MNVKTRQGTEYIKCPYCGEEKDLKKLWLTRGDFDEGAFECKNCEMRFRGF